MVERIPPHNTEAEKSVLGAAMLSKDALADVIDVVKADDFYHAAHKEIYSIMMELFRNNVSVDIITVCEELKKRKALELVGGRAYVASLSSEAPTISNAAEYAKIVAEKASMRLLIKAAEDIKEKSYEESLEPAEILNYAEKNIYDIAQRRQSRDYTPLDEILTENLQMIDRAIATQGQVIGLTTGFKALDALTSGLHKSELIIVAARPAMGKTAFVLNIAQNAALKGGASVLIFSLEMSKEQLGQRLLSMEARVEADKLKKGNIERTDWDRIHLGIDNLVKAKIHIDDTPGITIMEMKNKCRRLKAERGLDLIVVDYLQLMSTEGKSESRQNEISTLSRYLKLLAREMDCPVIVLSQLSRAPEQRQDRRPILSDLRESGSIEQDADIVMFLYRDEYYNKENSDKVGVCEVNVAKHRSGETKTIELTWVGRYTKFSDKA